MLLSTIGRTFLVKMALRATLALAQTPNTTPITDKEPRTCKIEVNDTLVTFLVDYRQDSLGEYGIESYTSGAQTPNDTNHDQGT